MELQVPYFEQDDVHTCGPAVLRMFSAFLGDEKTPDEINATLPTNPQHGAKNADMIAAAERLGFEAEARDNASLDDVQDFLEQGVPVIVNFLEPDINEGHHSLVVGMTDDDVVFNDPWHGKGFTLSRAEFEARWRSGFEDTDHWLMVVSKKADN